MSSLHGSTANNNYLNSVKKKHETVSEKLERLLTSPSASDVEIMELKKMKLKYKEELDGIR